MSLFEQFPYTNFHELNLDWLIQAVKDYGASVVLSVNGQTGDVILYQDPNVRFPDVDSTNWTLVRTANGHELGIQFQNGMAFLRFDNNTERIYTTGNPPPYPVTSVDGQTGDVQVFPNADTVLPAVDNTRTILRRQIKDSNNQDIFTGVQAEADVLKRLSGTNLYPIYDQGNPPPYPVTSVNGSTGAVILAIPFADVSGQEWTANDASPSNIWEMSRYTQNGALATIRLTTANGLTEGYLEFFDEGTQTTVTKKILTTDDIPSSSGVVSLNGLTGVVTLYGSTMDLYSGSPDTVKDAIDYTRSAVAYREDGATASQNIPNGSYVIWQGEPYISTAAISSGDTLSGSNLSAKPQGIANALKSDINALNNQMTYKTGDTFPTRSWRAAGRITISGKALYCWIDLAKPVNATSFDLTFSESPNIFGIGSYTTSGTISNKLISGNELQFTIDLSSTHTPGQIGIAEFIASITLT